MKKKKFRIFIGPHEIANVNALLASALKEKEIKVTAVTDKLTPYQAGMKYDKVLSYAGFSKVLQVSGNTYRSLESSVQSEKMIFRAGHKILPIFKIIAQNAIRFYGLIIKSYYFVKFFLRHDAFIFLFGTSLLPDNLDLPLYKLFHKKTVMWFHGTDIRHYEALDTTIREMVEKYRPHNTRTEKPEVLKRKSRMIRRVEKHVDHIISYPSFSQLLTRDYLGKELASRINLPLDIGNIRYNNVPNPVPLVVHAPSNPEIKGTAYILKAVERLKKEEHDFEFRLLENTSNEVVRETLTMADIAVDQLFAVGPGMFALESMAAGCAVLGGNIPNVSGFPPELPIVYTNPENIYQNLKNLLENPGLRQELGEKGRRYVEKYHDYRKIADAIIRVLAGTGKT